MPRGYEIVLGGLNQDVVFDANFTAASETPTGGVALVFGDNIPDHHLQAMNVAKLLMDKLREDQSQITSLVGFARLSVDINGGKPNIAVSDVAGTDIPSEDEITLYVDDAVDIERNFLVLQTAFNYCLNSALEAGRSG